MAATLASSISFRLSPLFPLRAAERERDQGRWTWPMWAASLLDAWMQRGRHRARHYLAQLAPSLSHFTLSRGNGEGEHTSSGSFLHPLAGRKEDDGRHHLRPTRRERDHALGHPGARTERCRQDIVTVAVDLEEARASHRAISLSSRSSSKALKKPEEWCAEEGDRLRLSQLRPPVTIVDTCRSGEPRFLSPPSHSVHSRCDSNFPGSRPQLAMKPLPLALSPVSTPTISGDETTANGFARMSSTFLLLVASAEEPPFAADTDGKLVGELCCCCCCFLLTEPMTGGPCLISA